MNLTDNSLSFITRKNRRYYGGMTIVQKQNYRFPHGHACYGCPFISGSDKVLGCPCRDRKICMYAFFQHIEQRRRDEKRICDGIAMLERVIRLKEQMKPKRSVSVYAKTGDRIDPAG